MKEKRLKAYSITLIVKPKQIGINRYSTKTFKGIAFAHNPTDAKEQSINQIIESFNPEMMPVINREVISIKECNIHNDFINKSE